MHACAISSPRNRNQQQPPPHHPYPFPQLMLAPPIPRSGRCNYFRGDRAKMSSGRFPKAIALHRARSHVSSPPLAGFLYQLIPLTDCPRQFHYRQLARGGEVWSRCKGAAREQRTGACMPTRTAGQQGGSVRKLADETLLAVG